MAEIKEKRKHPRVKTDNLLSYVCVDEHGNQWDPGIGRALDISQGGLLMEGHMPIKTDKILLTSVDVNNDLIEITGKIAYCRESGPGLFQTGIHFLEDKDKIRHIVVNMIKVFNLQKEK